MALVLAAALSAGCTATGGATLATRFVTPGTPAVDLGGPRPAPPPRAAGATQGPRQVARASSGLGTLEAMSPRLREALAALGASPSVAGFLAVAAAYRTHGVDDRAFDYLAEGLTRFPRAAPLHDAVARTWRDWGLADRALRHAHLAVRYAPASAATHNTLGTVLWALADRDAAAREFAAAVALDPTADYARLNLCQAASALGHPRSQACPSAAPAPTVPPPS